VVIRQHDALTCQNTAQAEQSAVATTSQRDPVESLRQLVSARFD